MRCGEINIAERAGLTTSGKGCKDGLDADCEWSDVVEAAKKSIFIMKGLGGKLSKHM